MGKRVNKKVVNFIQDGSYFFKRGQRAYYEQDLSKAKKNFERAVHFDPNQASYQCQLAVVLADLGELNRSIELLHYILRDLDANMAECFYLLAANYAYLGDFRQAEGYAKKYLKTNPNGEYELELQDLLEMIYEELGTDEPNWDEEELIMKQEAANRLIESGQYYAAIEDLQKLIAEHPNHWPAYNQMALAYFYSHQIETAIETLFNVLERNEGNVQALCHLAVIYHYSGMKTTSEEVVELLKNVHPFHEEQRHKLGITFAILKQYDLGYKWLYSLYKVGYDGNPMYYYWLTVCAVQLGKKQVAEKVWKRAFEEEDEDRLTSLPDPFLSPKEAVLSEEKLENSSFDFSEALSVLDKLKNSPSFRSALVHKLYNASMKTKCRILFTIYKLSDQESEKALLTYAANKKEPMLCRQLAELFHLKLTSNGDLNHIDVHVVQSFTLLENLEQYKELSLEDVFNTWFIIFLNVKVKNIEAWSSAVIYYLRKKTNMKVTQSDIAKQCNVSVSTLRNHFKKLEHILSIEENTNE
ncbi:hypothetical protein CIB95_12305 [Lottiidibacillus patelloidae]|uniref:Uncharacterized protein n=1 Tax=Lottiidibacillus patelloidae TaxID=2670334 RepID=A0A263BTN7_9BACI|nr:tetratricopeptide repeat protein [Lottiidibacillus patelloidae]OZM56546.1 hypothetical protein CIB95_12305 [Lottiidibacillus patelloidae]